MYVIDKSISGEPLDASRLRLKEADPFSLDSLIAWLEKQPGETRYYYGDAETCLLGRYTAAHGGTFDRCAGVYVIGSHVASHIFPTMPVHLNKVANPSSIDCYGTFADALDRARALKAETP